MANFNPGLADKTDPSYMKEAKDVNLIDFTGAENKEVSGARLKAANDLLNNTIKSTADTIKEAAFSEIQQGVDERRGAQGVDLATSTAEATDAQTNGALSGNKPPNANEIENQFKRFQTARDQGKLTDTNYYGQLESLVRSVKSRYPGFERDIDQMIHRATGITPANALREAIQQDMAAAAAASQKNSTKEETFVNSNLKWLSEQNLKDYSDGKLPFSSIQEIVRRNESYEASINRTKAELSRDSELKKVSDEKIVSGARNVAATVQSHLSDNFLSLANKAQEQMDKGAYDPKVFLAAMPQFRLQATNALQSQLNSKEFINMPKEERAAIEKQFNDTLDNYEKAFTNPETGLLNFYKNQASARVDVATSNLLDRSPMSNQVAAAQRLFPGILPSLLSQGEGATITEDIKQGVLNKQVPGSINYNQPNQNNLPEGTKQELTNAKINAVIPDGVTPQQQLDSIGNFPLGRSAGTTNSFINNWQSVLTNPKLPPEAIKTAADKMFNKGNVNFILDNFKNDGSQANAYQKLTSPAVTAQMVKLKGTDTWNNYAYFAKSNFAKVYQDQVQTLNKIANYPYIDLVFDEKTGRFGVKPSEEGIRTAMSKKPAMMGWSTMDTIERFMGVRVSGEIDKLNKSIDTIRPVLEGDNYNTSREIRNITNHLGEHSDVKNQGIWSLMLKAMGPSDKAAADGAEFGGSHPNFTQASGGKGSSGGKLSLENSSTEDIKAAFSRGESGDDYNRLVDTPTHPKRTNLTDMTIAEVLDYQKGMLRAGNPSSAAGKYMIVSKTLRSLVNEGVVKLDEKYDQNTQERLADALLERRGFQDFQNGKLPVRKFLKNLGDEWEIIKRSPKYAKQVLAALENSND